MNLTDEIVQIVGDSIPIEEARPPELVSGDASAFVSNSPTTDSLLLLHNLEDVGGETGFVEKALLVAEDSKFVLNELKFYVYLGEFVSGIDGLRCPRSLAVRVDEASSTVTLRMSFESGSHVIRSQDEKLNAVRAFARFASAEPPGAENGLDWVPKRSNGFGHPSALPSVQNLDRLLTELGANDVVADIAELYQAPRAAQSAYTASPRVLCHGDANHENIRACADGTTTLAVDWARIRWGSVGEDAARLAQPWLIFESEGNVAEVAETLKRSFMSELSPEHSRYADEIRGCYEVRTVAASVALAAHYGTWIKGCKDDALREYRALRVVDWLSYVSRLARSHHE